jgi:HSP20 family molecular chaperone IbpA
MRQLARFTNNWYDYEYDESMTPNKWYDNSRIAGNEMHGPQTDVHETGTGVKIAAHLPGINWEDICIEFDDETRTLCIFGETTSKKQEFERYNPVANRYNRFERRIRMPHNAMPDQLSATMTNNILHIEVPKQPRNHETAQNDGE